MQKQQGEDGPLEQWFFTINTIVKQNESSKHTHGYNEGSKFTVRAI